MCLLFLPPGFPTSPLGRASKWLTLGSHGMKLWKWSLNCVRDPKMLETPELWGICYKEPHTGSGTCPREKYAADSKDGSVGPSNPSDIRHGITGFGVCPDRFQFCFGVVFLHYASFPCFWNGMYSLCHCRLNYGICFFILILHRVTFKSLESQKRLWIF